MRLDISNRKISSLIDFFNNHPLDINITELICSYNQLTSLVGCPSSMTFILRAKKSNNDACWLSGNTCNCYGVTIIN